MMVRYAPRGGEDLIDCLKSMIRLAAQEDALVVATFNDVEMQASADSDIDALQRIFHELRAKLRDGRASSVPMLPAEMRALEARVKALERELSQARVIEARVTARMEASERRERLEQMMGHLAEGWKILSPAEVVQIRETAEALLAEVDRHYEREPR